MNKHGFIQYLIMGVEYDMDVLCENQHTYKDKKLHSTPDCEGPEGMRWYNCSLLNNAILESESLSTSMPYILLYPEKR